MRMKRINRYKLVVASLLLWSSSALAQFQEERIVDKAIAVAPNVKIAIQNRHGNITVNSWEKDSVVMRAVISAESKSLEKLQTALSSTKVNFEKQGDYISISRGTTMSSFDRSISEIKSAAGVNELTIDYQISIPIGARLSLINRYGDIFLDNHDGEINLEISHGSFRARNLKRITQLNSNFGNIYITSAKRIDGSLLFSDFEIEKCDELSVNSKSTSYEIEDIKHMLIRTTNDKINIDKIKSFNIMGSLSKVTIDHLNKSLDANLNYGKIRIKKVEATTTSMTLFSNRTTFDFTFDPNLLFTRSGNCENCEITNDNILTSRTARKEDKALIMRYSCQKTKFYFR